MKKSLIAIAVVGAFSAPAFAATTLYGTLDAAVVNVSNTNEKSQMTVVSGGLAPSLIGVKGAEDVGDGLNVVYQAEFMLDSQDASSIGSATMAARQKLLGLSGSFGTVAAGYLQTTGFDFATKFDPTADSSVSALQNMTAGHANFLIGSNATATRAQRALAYISPNMSGFSVALNYSTALAGLGNAGVSNAKPDQNVTATLVSANYDNGPLAVGGVYAATSVQANTNANEKEYSLGASYDFGAAKLLGTYQSTSNSMAGTAGNTDKIYSLSGVIPAGPGAVVLGYAHANIGTVNDANGTSYTAAYLHNLSKTATLYGALSRTTNGTNGTFSVDNGAVAAAQGASASSTLVAVGLKKSF